MNASISWRGIESYAVLLQFRAQLAALLQSKTNVSKVL